MPLLTFIVEDKPLVLQGLSEALEEMGAVRVVGSAASASDAIGWLAQHRGGWRLLIIDLALDRSSGLEVVAACRDRAGDQRALVLTNYATPEMRRRCLALGVDAVFDKSTEIDELVAFCVALADA